MKVTIQQLNIDTYIFDVTHNPYVGSSNDETISLAEVAHSIAEKIDSLSIKDSLIIRGIQSGKHVVGIDELLQVIIKDGQEYQDTNEPYTIFAAPYTGKNTVLHILEGFHMFKPKSEERPQYPVDIWLIYDAKAYENIEYLHPRHAVLARDKWKRRLPNASGLHSIIVIT